MKMTLGELAKCAILGFWMGTHLYLQMIGKRLSVRGGDFVKKMDIL
jgi:hypothetical protein